MNNMKTKSIICIIIGTFLTLITIIFFLHLQKINSFYFSYKYHEPFSRQQENFFDSINNKQLRKTNIVILKENHGSVNIRRGISFKNKSYNYNFIRLYPDQPNSNLLIVIYDVQTNKTIISFVLTKDLKNRETIISGNKAARKNIELYQNKSVKTYKRIYQQVYDNWKFQWI